MALRAQVYRSCILWFVFVLVAALDNNMKLEQEMSESQDGCVNRPNSTRISAAVVRRRRRRQKERWRVQLRRVRCRRLWRQKVRRRNLRASRQSDRRSRTWRTRGKLELSREKLHQEQVVAEKSQLAGAVRQPTSPRFVARGPRHRR